MKTRYIMIIIIALTCCGIALASLIIDFNILSLLNKIGLLLMLFACVLVIYLASYHTYPDIQDKALKSKKKGIYGDPGTALMKKSKRWWYNNDTNWNVMYKYYDNNRLPSSLTDDEILHIYKKENLWY